MQVDINGDILKVGDTVYYARKRDHMHNGELVISTITKICDNGHVRLGSYTSTSPRTQLVIIT